METKSGELITFLKTTLAGSKLNRIFATQAFFAYSLIIWWFIIFSTLKNIANQNGLVLLKNSDMDLRTFITKKH